MLSITCTMDFIPYHNDESLYRRRGKVKDSISDESFTAYFPFYPISYNILVSVTDRLASPRR